MQENEESNAAQAQETAAPRRLTASQVRADLDNGMTRAEIKDKYQLTNNEMARIFSGSLKGAKTKKSRRLSFEFEDDLLPQANSTNTAAPAAATEENLVSEQAAPATRQRRSTAAIQAEPTPTPAVEEPSAPVAEEPAPAPVAEGVTNNVENPAPVAETTQETANNDWGFGDDDAAVEELPAEEDRPPFDM